jgi:hypothetical protein
MHPSAHESIVILAILDPRSATPHLIFTSPPCTPPARILVVHLLQQTSDPSFDLLYSMRVILVGRTVHDVPRGRFCDADLITQDEITDQSDQRLIQTRDLNERHA